ncbi:hypothetical protein BDA99DRAFT_565171 [Phascolomyces articulosus]|uniref:Uncharacterized protein n=1 Tax=Phascolomyces articulosus TaxID=60185 RepID=A0AAD5K210_9FUNG|nr:hypothetical protein BDA99DRAFT_565171 [Phascolomyces articulosus]
MEILAIYIDVFIAREPHVDDCGHKNFESLTSVLEAKLLEQRDFGNPHYQFVVRWDPLGMLAISGYYGKLGDTRKTAFSGSSLPAIITKELSRERNGFALVQSSGDFDKSMNGMPGQTSGTSNNVPYHNLEIDLRCHNNQYQCNANFQVLYSNHQLVFSICSLDKDSSMGDVLQIKREGSSSWSSWPSIFSKVTLMLGCFTVEKYS